jgi:hypothetical protein
MSQRIEILRHLAKGRALTTFEAFEKFHCTRLAARIAEIRSEGHRVSAEMVTTSGGARVAKYRIAR